MSKRTVDIAGKRFGRLVVVCKSSDYMTKTTWTCACDCGAEIGVFYQNLKSGKVRSCGCTRMSDLREYIEARVVPVPFSGCWIWMDPIHADGYGNIYIPELTTRLAHRASHHVFNGPVPDDKLVMHSCDTPSCVCPDHLSIGTDRDNTIDMYRKGRGVTKLDDDGVRAVRAARLSGETQLSIARRFGISQTLVSNIANGLRRSSAST